MNLVLLILKSYKVIFSNRNNLYFFSYARVVNRISDRMLVEPKSLTT